MSEADSLEGGAGALWWVTGPGGDGRFLLSADLGPAIELFEGLTGVPAGECRGELVREGVGRLRGAARLALPRELAVLGAREVRLGPTQTFLMMHGRVYRLRELPLLSQPMDGMSTGVVTGRVKS